uniref:Glutaredoxin-related protein 5, mitochondrial n=1 Tax=Eptatretus burgeri TaxID=7764 RepID=A0A8C4QJM8_EPTBU
MYAGHSGKERYIPVHGIVHQLGPTVCVSLLAAHALTGCDTMCSMNRIGKKTVVVFMKGIPTQPLCGFSNAVVQILRMHGVENYTTYNVLEDESLREGIKEFSNWPTIPQVFFNGEFVGGCDILLQMHQNGDLVEELQKVGIMSALQFDETKN